MISPFELFQYALAIAAGIFIVIMAVCSPQIVGIFHDWLKSREKGVSHLQDQVTKLRAKVYDLETIIGTSDKVRSIKK